MVFYKLWIQKLNCYNRTYVELKSAYRTCSHIHAVRYNRTYVELKFVFCFLDFC